MKLLLYVLVFISLVGKAQILSYGKTTFHETGEPLNMITPQLKIENKSNVPVEVYVNRFYQNLPAGWTNCYCYISCHPPALDTLRFTLNPSETATIGIGFNTNEIPAAGEVKLTVEVIGGIQKDTLSFSASTLLASLNKNFSQNALKMYPNPASSFVFLNSLSNESYSLNLLDAEGRMIYSSGLLLEKTHTLPVEHLAPGKYSVQAIYNSGKIQTQHLIKN